MCERRTGKTKEEWEQVQKKKRRKAVADGFASEDRLYTEKQYKRMMAHGFDPEQLRRVLVPVEAAQRKLKGGIPKRYFTNDPDQKVDKVCLWAFKPGALEGSEARAQSFL